MVAATEPLKFESIAEPLTWTVCVKYEPRLLDIVRRIDAIKDKNEQIRGTSKLRYSYALDCWYGYRGHIAIKQQLNRIIGWVGDTSYEELRGQEAHDLCYHYLFDLLTS